MVALALISNPPSSGTFDADQRVFEAYLASNGAVFNGTSDDGPAIQAAINALTADNKDHFVWMPSGNLTAAIKSSNGSTYGLSTDAAGITLPTNLSLDLNGCILQGSNLSSGPLVAVIGNSTLPNSYGRKRISLKNGTLQASGTVSALLEVRNTAADTGPARQTFEHLFLWGNSTNPFGIVTGENVYLLNFKDCEIKSCTKGLYARLGANTNQGELINFSDCVFYNCQTAGGCAIWCDSQQLSFSCCSFDYCAQLFGYGQIASLASGGTLGSGSPANLAMCDLYGCHLESGKSETYYAAANQYLVQIPSTGTQSHFSMFGGELYLTTGSGNALAGFFDPGTTGAAAPYGISLDRVTRFLNSATLNNASATGRFVDNQ